MANAKVRLWRRLLDGWYAVAGRFGAVQTLLILAIAYVFILGPVALASAVARRDHLGKRGLRSSGSAWEESDSAKPDLERAKLTS